MGGLGLFENVVHSQDPDRVFEQELAYFDLQQAMAQRYGQNLSHADYIRIMRQRRELFKQQS